MNKINLKIFLIILLPILSGCATAKSNLSYENFSYNNNNQIEIGKSNIIIDALGNIISLPKKVILLDRRVDSHTLSPGTIEALNKYLEANPQIRDTKIRINQFAPIGEFKRLVKNKKIHWWWRVFPGIPVTLFSCAGRLIGGDNYNPYTDTINLYSDLVPVALHEASHAVDATEKVKEGWADYYALGRILPPITLYQEFVATEKTITYLVSTKDRREENNAYRLLYPAYGTYVGGYSSMPYGDLAGAGVGHILSIVPRYDAKLIRKAYENSVKYGEPVPDSNLDPLTKSLVNEHAKAESELNRAISQQIFVYYSKQ